MERQDERGYDEVVGELQRRWPDAKVVPSLDREEMLVDLLGGPHTTYPAVHVGGTNGKSSVTRMVDALLAAHGLRTGRYTSPEFSLSERIALYGRPVTEARFVELYDEVRPYVQLVDGQFEQPLTAFEVVTAMAFAAFADAPVDAAVIEVGMGGSWDCTNVINARVVALLPIALDHQEYLGDRIEDIADEKAGIIHKGATVVCSAQVDDAMEPILRRCAEVGATLAREGREFGVANRSLAVGGQVLTLRGLSGTYDEIFLPLHGAHQAQNAAVALAAVEAFLGAGTERTLDPELVRAGFAAATSPGRLERVRNSPPILLDAAHNPAGMAATVAALRDEFGFDRLIAVVAALGDKDVRGMLEHLDEVADAVVATRNTSPRTMSAAALGALAEDVFGEERVTVVPSLPDAIATAVTLAEEDDDALPGSAAVLITGSVVTVADARKLFRR